MPELEEDRRVLRMDGLDRLLPAFGLRVVVDAGRVDPADALFRNDGGLGNEEPGRGPLRVVFGHKGVRQSLLAGRARVIGARTTRL